MNYQVKKMNEFSTGNFFVVYGRPSSGKTHFIGTFPKLLVVSFGDKGLNTLKSLDADFIEFVDTSGNPKKPTDTFDVLEDMITSLINSPYETIAFDTFGVYIDRLQRILLDTTNKKSMTQQMWGDLQTQVKLCLDAMKKLAETKYVITTFHESTESTEGYENEITPSVGAFVSPGIKKALYGTANYAFHTFIYNYIDPSTQKSIPYYAMHIGTHPYYWTKFQTDKTVPEFIFNPTFTEIQKIIKGE